jgi:hypothetical protein
MKHTNRSLRPVTIAVPRPADDRFWVQILAAAAVGLLWFAVAGVLR